MKHLIPLFCAGCGATAYPGLFGISPGLGELASLAGPKVRVAHSDGCRVLCGELKDPTRPQPSAILLVDPWPTDFVVPPGPWEVVVVCGRHTRVRGHPVKFVQVGHPHNWWEKTVGHLTACLYEESIREAKALGEKWHQ